MSSLRPVLIITLATLAATVGCASDHQTVTTGPAKHLWLSGSREPFTFSSWDVGRIEWSAPANNPAALPPDVSAVLADGTIVPFRTLTLATARGIHGLTIGSPVKADDHRGDVWPDAVPAVGSGFHFDFVNDRLVHLVAAPVNNADGSTTQPVLANHAAADVDANGDPRRYTLPLDHDSCIHLFGNFDGLETDLSLPPLLPK